MPYKIPTLHLFRVPVYGLRRATTLESRTFRFCCSRSGYKSPTGGRERETERQREREREEANVDYLAASLATVNWHGASQSTMPGKADVIASADLLPAVRRNVEAKPARTTPSYLFPRDREKRHGTFPGQLWFHHGHCTA